MSTNGAETDCRVTILYGDHSNSYFLILMPIFSGIKAEAGAEFLVGFESEFTLLKSDEPAVAVGTYQFSSSASLRTGAVATIVMDKIARAILLSGIELQMYHGEAGPGQVDLSCKFTKTNLKL